MCGICSVCHVGAVHSGGPFRPCDDSSPGDGAIRVLEPKNLIKGIFFFFHFLVAHSGDLLFNDTTS